MLQELQMQLMWEKQIYHPIERLQFLKQFNQQDRRHRIKVYSLSQLNKISNQTNLYESKIPNFQLLQAKL